MKKNLCNSNAFVQDNLEGQKFLAKNVITKKKKQKKKLPTLFFKYASLWFLAISEIGKYAVTRKVCWHDWYPATRQNIIESYSGKKIPILFPEMALSSLEG